MLASFFLLASLCHAAAQPEQFTHPLAPLAHSLRHGLLTVEESVGTASLFTCNCTSFHYPSQPCNVTWLGVPSPTPDDIIALYVPAHADPSTSVPVQVRRVPG